MVKEVASKTSDVAGDGTTTATVLAQAINREGLKYLAGGMNAMDLERGIDKATTQFIGLTRWDIPPATLALPGVQGGWFAMPDPGLHAQFRARYEGA